MSWREEAARALAESPGGWSGAAGAAAGAAAVDARETAIATSPAGLPPDARFEIGSVTKTMTGTLLALLAAEGTLSLDDPAGRWLRAGPHAGITIRQLATHTSGLPAMGPNRQAADPADPWAGQGQLGRPLQPRAGGQARERVSVAQLGRAWAAVMPDAAPGAGVIITAHELAASGAVVADLALTVTDASTGTAGARGVRLVILPDGQLGGFTPRPRIS